MEKKILLDDNAAFSSKYRFLIPSGDCVFLVGLWVDETWKKMMKLMMVSINAWSSHHVVEKACLPLEIRPIRFPVKL